ncbi:transcriptional regulator [Kitasatospora sp. SolWspMP-SS2h]|uniref:BTAD domain-containing putative transcriptional regulator n=1 Tax=Kitasatospora sp. SolWspMP-SS2h TaxID=1305729 RepID=UPI000DC04061|nr:BTAD domain-containing putative transcriptional regulator [Kitasatospora sp. SolWspMP-SS2h]RAJ32039.1 transcriptional regulator [Kitasatospora sp. SolWspMP-SS2h]
MVRITVLGTLTAQVAGAATRLGGPRQRGVLARLLVARGTAVPADRLIDGLWDGRPPAKAVTSLQAYVSNLRRLLEPQRGPRQAARLLVSEAGGYALRGVRTDAQDFEDLLDAAGVADSASGVERFRAALGLWQGPAYHEFADRAWAAPEIARLEELRTTAREFAIEADLAAGRARPAAQEAAALVEDHPLREQTWRLLALALWHSGRQADALAAIRRARTYFATELGLDPGPLLTTLESAILHQRTDQLAPGKRPFAAETTTQTAGLPGGVGLPGAGVGVGGVSEVGLPGLPGEVGLSAGGGAGAVAGSVLGPTHASASGPASLPAPASASLPAFPSAGPDRPAGGRPQVFVGRRDELAALLGAAGRARGGVGFALVSGEAGVGKSTVLGRLRERLAADGWRVLTGRCPESAGAPAAWAWTEVLRELAWHEPDTAADPLLAPLLAGPELTDRQDPLSGRFRLHRAVVARLHAAARTVPLAVLLDDLHAADPETRELLGELAADQASFGAGGGLLLVAALRPGEGELAEVLARLARRSPVRVPLGGLAESDAGRLIEAVCAAPVRPETVRALAERTGGNPFYLAESAQLLALEGESTALRQVPQGVRDVLRRRFERLPAPAVDLLRLAAVAGRESDVDLLLRAGEQDEEAATEAVEAAVAGGLLLEPRPGTVRFAHVLVRDTLYADLGGLRRARLHGRIGHALHDLRPGELTALAHHFTQAATAATAALAVDHCVRAAEAAERRYAHPSAVGLLRQAVDNLDRAAERPGEDRAARRIDLLGALLRAQVRAGQVTAATGTKARALRLARESGREDLLIAAWTAWTEPTPWITHPYGTFDQEAVDQLTRLLRRTDLPPATRCRLLDALTQELDCTGSPEAFTAGSEAVAIARAEGDPLLLCLAIAAQARSCDHELAPIDRARLAAELAELATGHDLPAYRWHAEHLAATAAAVHGDLPALRRHLAAGEEIAHRYGLPELADVVLFQRGMLELAAGRVDEAVARYERALAGLRARDSLHAGGLAALIRVVIAHRQGRLAEMLPLIEEHRAQYGPLVADVTALALLAAGHGPEAARRARGERRGVQADYFRSLFLQLRADLVIALDERAEAAELLDEMRPLGHLVAGAASTSIAVRPVALTLGELARHLGRTAEAAAHFRRAAEVARRWEAPGWEAEARAALERLPAPGEPGE